MRRLKKFNESTSEWWSSIEEIMDHFNGFKDMDCDVSVMPFWLTKELDKFSKIKRPGYYPGFVVNVSPTFKGGGFQNWINKHISYLKELSDCHNRLPEYYPVCNISQSDPVNGVFGYRFTFLDNNWESITWSDDSIYQENFVSNFGNPTIRFGSVKKQVSGSTILLTYTQPVTKQKSNTNILNIRDYINQRFPDHDIEITEELQKSTGLQKNILVTSISLHCKGKKTKEVV